MHSSTEPALRRIEARLEDLSPRTLNGQEALGLAIRESLLAPGKRLRPLLTMSVAEDLGATCGSALDAGCALEMVHAASLILDDMPCMDDAALRRGRPATHVAHGEDVALLATIALLSHAYSVVSGIGSVPASARSEATAILSHAVGTAGLVGGQFADLRGGRKARSLTEIARANRLKTASLFLAAVELGAVMAGASQERRETLQAFARELGEAFQLLDDLLDTGANPIVIGKDVGQDAGKSTIVSLVGPASVERRILRHREAAETILTEALGPESRTSRLVAGIFRKASAPSIAPPAEALREEEAALR